MKTPFAILLCKLQGDDSEPLPRSRYEEIFTSAGQGKWGMVDYFRDMSHGLLDLNGSRVFGWFQLDQPYVGSGKNPQGRRDLITWARQKAADNNVPLGDFYSVVVVLNEPRDLFGLAGLGAVGGDDGSNNSLSGLCPSLMGQEMGHVYGLLHSRAEPLQDDYRDQYDIMSTMNAYMAPHPIYGERIRTTGDPAYQIGLGLNAAG